MCAAQILALPEGKAVSLCTGSGVFSHEQYATLLGP